MSHRLGRRWVRGQGQRALSGLFAKLLCCCREERIGAATLVLLTFPLMVSCDGSNVDSRFERSVAPPQEMVFNGLHFVQRGPATFTQARAGTLSPAPTEATPITPDPNAAQAVAQLSLAEYADALRLVTLYQGYEYIQADPDLALAARLRSDPGAAISNPSGTGHASPQINPTDAGTVGRSLVGSYDHRDVIYAAYIMPFNAYLAINFQDGGCSGVSIGGHTAISAGHCFYENGAWHNFDPAGGSFIAPGANVANAPPYNFPWGKFTCYQVWMYNGWTSGGSRYYDMAMMDFTPCGNGNNPAWAAGYTGTYANWGNSLHIPLTIFGYPGSCPGLVGWPELCGMPGNAEHTSSSTPQYIFTENIDTSPGDSGTPWTWTNPSNGWYQVLGTHIGDYGNPPWQPVSNFGRYLDSLYWSLIQIGSDY